jgi:hypothetical protein
MVYWLNGWTSEQQGVQKSFVCHLSSSSGQIKTLFPVFPLSLLSTRILFVTYSIVVSLPVVLGFPYYTPAAL